MGVRVQARIVCSRRGRRKPGVEGGVLRVSKSSTAIMSDYDADSELSHLSQSGPAARADPSERPTCGPCWSTRNRLAAQSGGTFDITVGPYVKLWRRARRDKQMPSAERLREARRAVGYQHLKLDAEHHTAQLLRPRHAARPGRNRDGLRGRRSRWRVLARWALPRRCSTPAATSASSDPPPGKTGWRIGIAPLAEDASPSRYLMLANGRGHDLRRRLSTRRHRRPALLAHRRSQDRLGSDRSHGRVCRDARLFDRRQPGHGRVCAGAGRRNQADRKDARRGSDRHSIRVRKA